MIKRWFIRGVVSILFGLLATVTVAWGLEARFGRDTRFPYEVWRYSKFEAQAVGWIHHYGWRRGHGTSVVVPATMSSVPDESGTTAPPGALKRCVQDIEQVLQQDESRSSGNVRVSGWPFLALHRDIVFTRVVAQPGANRAGGMGWDGSTLQRRDRGLIQFELPGQRQFRLSYLPIWRGLILNTAFYALPCLALWLVCALYRRRSRARRGLCVSCAYDLRGTGHGRCPECGTEF